MCLFLCFGRIGRSVVQSREFSSIAQAAFAVHRGVRDTAQWSRSVRLFVETEEWRLLSEYLHESRRNSGLEMGNFSVGTRMNKSDATRFHSHNGGRSRSCGGGRLADRDPSPGPPPTRDGDGGVRSDV